MGTMGKIVAAYARVSTERQAESQTIEQQLTALRAYAAGQGWTLTDEQVYRDEGWSGARLDRPALDRLRDAVSRALVDTLLIASPDRLVRRYAYQVWLLEEFARAGCEVVFLDRPPRDDPQDALLVQIRGAVAEYERAVIADRTRRGRLAALQAGRLVPWSRPPYGYCADPRAPRDPAGVTVDTTRAAVVRQIFTWYVEDGLTFQAIARRLTAAGTPTARGHARWGPPSVGGILRNSAYQGTAFGNRQERVPSQRRFPLSGARSSGGRSTRTRPSDGWIAVPIPAIVTPEVFAAAQDRLARNRAWSPRNTQGEYLLRRLVSCRRCGRAESIGNNGRYAYYRCLPRPGDLGNGHAERCRGQSLPIATLDAAVWADVCHVLTDPAILDEAVRRAQAGWLSDDARAARQDDLRRRRTTLDRQRQRLIDAYAAEALTLDELQARTRGLNARLSDLAREEQQLAASAEQQAQVAVLAGRVEDFRASIAQELERAAFARRRELVELLIDRVLVDGGDVEIRYIIPFGGTAQRKVALQSGHLGGLILQQQHMLRLMGDGRLVGERGVAALAIVPDLQPLEDRLAGGGTRRPDPGVDQFGLQGGEETLGHGVIEALACPAHRAGDAARGEGYLVGSGGILTAPIGVVDESRAGATGMDGHGEGVERQFGAQVVGHRPADDAPRVGIHQDGEIEPTFRSGDIRDVPKPEPVRCRRREVARHQVRGGRVCRIGDGRAGASPPVAADEARRAHQARHPLAGTVHALRP